MSIVKSVAIVAGFMLIAAPAVAQDPAVSPIAITGGAALTSDYRFRGLSQTNKRFAVQGTATVSHQSGLYAAFWGSSIDDYIANGGDAEIDLSAGYKKTIDGTTIDGGLLYYYYPGSGGVNSDFFEPYINASHTFGPLGVKVGGNFAWKQHGLATGTKARAGGTYLYGELSAAVPTTGITLTGHLGRSFTKNYITFGDKYTDWSVTAAYTYKAVTFSASYVDTNRSFASYPTGGGYNRDVAKAGVVGAVSVAF